MMGLRQFIPHSNYVSATAVDSAYPHTDAILRALHDGTSTDQLTVMTLVGKKGTGKSAMLKYFAVNYRQEICGVDTLRAPIIYADYQEVEKNALATGPNSITATLLSAIMFRLAMLARHISGPHALPAFYRAEQSIYTPRQLLWLFDQICLELSRLRVRCLIIDNAHKLDAKTISLLFRLREKCQYRIGLILCAEQDRAETKYQPMERLLNQAQIERSDCEEPIELHPLLIRNFKQEVVSQIFADIDSKFAPDLAAYQSRIVARFWEVTHGDWKSIDGRVRHINRLLGPRTQAERVITQALIEQVFAFQLAQKS